MDRRYRLSKNKEFKNVYKRGRVISNPLLVLIYHKNGYSYSRVGFSVSKKFGKAVKRNRIKRQLKEIYRANMNNIKTGYDFVFVVRKDTKQADFGQLQNAVGELFRRARLFDLKDSNM